MSKNKKVNKIEEAYKKSQEEWKSKIRLESNKFKRFWKWIWFLLAFPFIWLWYNIRDWRTFLIFALVFIIVSSEVWIPFLIALICWANETIRYSMLGVASACWVFWLGPGTPFLPLCICLTILVKALFNKIIDKRKKARN